MSSANLIFDKIDRIDRIHNPVNQNLYPNQN